MDIENFNTHYCPIMYKEFLFVDREIKIEVGYYNRWYWFPTPCPQSPLSSPEADNFLPQVLFCSHAQQPQSARGSSHTGREKNQGLNLLAALSLDRALLSCILQDYWDGVLKDCAPEAHGDNGSFRHSLLLYLPSLSNFLYPRHHLESNSK